ncbi:MAG: amidohydrolase family protein, partial [Candidatus Eremiobacteraeota bacterium]|nr:amidohydrolase family protein [Candidatus Eremiobacteraeota bacterium]
MPSRPLVLRHATLFPDPESPPVRDAAVVVRDGGIAGAGNAILAPADAVDVDCSGCAIVAGFWNCHVHFFERKWADAAAIPSEELCEQLADFTRYGFTTVFDLSSPLHNTNALRARVAAGVSGPRILTTGEGLIPPNGLPAAAALRALGLMDVPLPEASDPQRARRAAESLIADGADAVKCFASSQNGGSLSTEVMHAIADCAHARGKPAFAHVNAPADVASATAAGVDVIAHTTPPHAWDLALFEMMRDAGVALTPTLHLWQHVLRHDRAARRREYAETAVQQLRAWKA